MSSRRGSTVSTSRRPRPRPRERAAAAPGAFTTAALLLSDVGRLRTGESVLLHSAAGGVGQAVARLARRASAGLVLGSVGSSERAPAAQLARYDAVLVRGPGFVAKVHELTEGRGVGLVLDSQGTTLLEEGVSVTATGGRIVLFGNAGGRPLAALPPAGRLFGGNISIGGFSLAAWVANAPGRVAAALGSVIDHLAAGDLTR